MNQKACEANEVIGMKVEHVGYVRMSKRGKALKLDLVMEALDAADKYRGKDGKLYVGLVIQIEKLLDVLEKKREVVGIEQIKRE
jgi:hypothetical protein